MLLGGAFASYGSTTGKDLTALALNEMNRTADLAPGQTVQQVATLDGQRYGLGLTVDGRMDWYRIDTLAGDTRTTFAASSGAVASLSIADRNALTDQFARTTLSTADHATYVRMVSEIRTLGDISENTNPRIEPVGSVAMWDDVYRPEGNNHPAPPSPLGPNGITVPSPSPAATPAVPYIPGNSPAEGADPLALSTQTTYTDNPQWNVAQGRTPSGYELGTVVYEVNGVTHTVGAGSSTETIVPVAMVSSYRDEQTQAIIEVRVQGELVNGQFQATGGSYAHGMTPDGKVVIPGIIDNPNAAAQAHTAGLQDTFIQGEAAYANGFGPDGKPWNASTTVAPNATQSWGMTGNSNFVTRTTDITNPNGVVTQIRQTVDRSTGQVVTEQVYENGSLVATSEGGHRWAIDRETGQMQRLPGAVASADIETQLSEPPRASSSSFVTGAGVHTVTLNPGGTFSDIVLLQGRAGNPISVADLLAANPQYGDVSRIPAGAALNVPVRSGDNLTIHQSSGAVETINTHTGEITSVTTDAQGNTHQVVSRPDGEDGRIYIERTIDAGTGEVISASAVRVDSLSGQVTAIDPQHLTPLAQGGDQVQDASTNTLSGALSQQDIEALLSGVPQPGPAIAVLADAGPGTMTDAGPVNGYGDTLNTPPLPQPDPPRESANGSISLADLSATLSTAQGEQLLAALAAQGLSATDIAAVTIHTNPDGSRILANSEGDVIGTLTDADPSGSSTWTVLQLSGQPAQYIGPQGQVMSQAQYTTAQVADATNAIGAFNTLANGLDNWGDMNDAQRLSALATLYNQIDRLGSAMGALQGVDTTLLPGDMGQAAGGISGAMSLYYGLENGNELQAISGAVQLYSSFSGNAIPYVGVVLAVADIEENPWGAVSAALVQWGGPYGMIAAAVITMVLMSQDIDPSIGEASVNIDASGSVVVNTTQDEEGGGSRAAEWALRLGELALGAGMSAPQAGAPAQHLPSVGYYHDPDGFNFSGSQGQLALRWTDENGESHQILYGSDGMRWDGDSVAGQSDMLRDYMQLIHSMEPNWPPVMYEEVYGGILQRDYGVATVLYATALGSYDGQAAHTHGGDADTDGGVVAIELGSDRLYSFTDNTVESTSLQTEHTLTDGEIQSVPAEEAEAEADATSGMGANPNGPQIPRGRDPIVFVPLQALTGGNTRTVTAGMVQSLNGALSEAQLAAAAIALGAGGLAFASQAAASQAPAGDATQTLGTIALQSDPVNWGLNGPTDAGGAAPVPEGGNGLPLSALSNPSGPARTVLTPLLSEAPRAPVGVGSATVETPVLVSNPAPTPGQAGPSAPALPEGYGLQVQTGPAPLSASDGLALDFPTVGVDTLQGQEDGVLRFSAEQLLANDSTPNPVPRGYSGDYFNGMQIVSVGGAVHGQVGIQNGQLVFIPDPDYNGSAGFSYTVIDMYGLTYTGTVVVEVSAVNDAPVVRGESATGSEDATLFFSAGSLLGNDRDVDGDRLRIVRVGDATGGEVFLVNGNVQFVPTPDYHGPAGYNYWVSDGSEQVMAHVNLNIAAVNDAPVTGDESGSGDEDVAMLFTSASLLANDSDADTAVDGDVLTVARVGEAVGGTVELLANGDVRFMPAQDYNGPAGYSYWVSDGQAETRAQVRLTILPVNDAPVATGETGTSGEDAGLLFSPASLLANDRDVDGDALSLVRVGEANGGTAFLQPDGQVRFVPTPNFNGPAGYSYWISDGQEEVRAQVRLNVLQVNDLPVAQGELVNSDEDVPLVFPVALLLANDSDVDTDPLLNLNGAQTLTVASVSNAQHGTVSLVDGEVQFNPDPNYFGLASFDYVVDDGAGGQASTTVVMQLAPVNDAPVAQGESAVIAEDNALIYTQAQLLANESDVDNTLSQLHISQVGGAEHGNVELMADGRVRFVPDADYFGPARFDYLVDDGAGGQSLASVTLEVTPVNDAARLQGERVSAQEDTVVHLTAAQLLANDTDVDGPVSELRVTGVSGAQNGAVAMDAGGNISFTPTLNFYGQASFSYTVSDGMGALSSTTMVLDYTSVNDVPVVNNELVLGNRGVTYEFASAALLANDTDVEHPGSLQIVAVGGAQNGSVTLLPDGRVQFAPAANYEAWSPAQYGQFEYTVRDPNGGESTGFAAIDFSRVNRNPVAVDDAFYGYQDVRQVIPVEQLLRNDTDPDDNPLFIDQVRNASHGTVSLGTGAVTFTPSANYFGAASFEYRVNDGQGGTTWATADITLERENRAPVITRVTTTGGADATLALVEFPHPESGGDPYVTGTRLVDDPHRVNGMIYAVDPDGDRIDFFIRANGRSQHGVEYVGQYFDSSAPAGLSNAQLRGQQSTPSINEMSYSEGSIDVRAPDGWRHNYLRNNENNNGSGASAAWQYINNDVSGYTGRDSFDIVAMDSRGLSTTYTIEVSSEGWGGGGGGCFPVVVDTGDDGIDLVKPEDSIMFADINGDGWRDQIGWVSSSDALLAYDRNEDGLINQRDEVSFTSYLPGASTDLEGLTAFDSDGDGRLTVADAEWNQFGLLQDHNANGAQDSGEWVTLQEAGVTHIDLASDGNVVENNGNVVFGETTVVYADGSTRTAGDVMFAGAGIERPDWVESALANAPEQTTQTTAPPSTVSLEAPLEVDATAPPTASLEAPPVGTAPAMTSLEVPPVGTAPAVTPSIEQQANAFVQMVTTQDVRSEPLGFVDAQSLTLGSDPVNVADEPVVTVSVALPSSEATAPASAPALV